MAIKITKGNAHDVSAVELITKGLQGKIFGDKAYIAKDVFNKLYSRNLRLFTTIRKDMKNYLFELEGVCHKDCVSVNRRQPNFYR